MSAITCDKKRVIIEDFAREIRERRTETTKPSKTVINFRNDRSDGVERVIFRVPIDCLRYRKDNGRIASDVLDYETNIGILEETDKDAQEQIRQFLEFKDPEKTAILKKSIMHSGQLEPAIITCDGFLINGNRRKMVMESLLKERHDNDGLLYMKVVILPGEGEPGGPPTLLEIEKLENRYQLQSDGKADYYGFDSALSIKRKKEMGLSIEDQLRDDPQYAGATPAQIAKAAKETEESLLAPLACVDRYLKQFSREGQYRTISAGRGDPEGRWQAFIDYSNVYSRVFNNPKKLIEYGIEEDEIGQIEEAAFHIIRLRNLPDLPKLHVIMRELPKYCRTTDGKKEIKKISAEVDPILPPEDCLNQEGEPLLPEELDAKWAAKFRQDIIHRTKKAANSHEKLKEKETPIDLLEASYKKLIHADMDIQSIAVSDFARARQLAAQIKSRATELEKEIYQADKDFRKLAHK